MTLYIFKFMKCPHCNQEHLEGTKFCPETGKSLQFYQSDLVSNNCDKYLNPTMSRFDGTEEVDVILKSAGKRLLNVVKVVMEACGYGLAASKYLVESAPAILRKNAPLKEALALKVELNVCGADVEIQRYVSFPWSTSEDLKRGDVVLDGIVLGGPYPYEYTSGNIVPLKEGSIEYIPLCEGVYALRPLLDTNEESFCHLFTNPHIINEEFLSRSQESVEWMQVSLDCPLFEDLCISSTNEIANNIEVIEQLGYLRIRNFVKPSPAYNSFACFISTRPNTAGLFVFIVLFHDFLYFFNDVITECVSFAGGQEYLISKK